MASHSRLNLSPVVGLSGQHGVLSISSLAGSHSDPV